MIELHSTDRDLLERASSRQWDSWEVFGVVPQWQAELDEKFAIPFVSNTDPVHPGPFS